jgi:protein gp37
MTRLKKDVLLILNFQKMKKSKIEWTEATWNPSIGCNKVSSGCKFCYAETMAKRLKAMGVVDYKDGFKFKIVPERIPYPLKVRKPTKFFVNSMSDLFHERMPQQFLDAVFETIIQTPHHIYQILTKRDNMMIDYFKNRKVPDNVWLGVTVENSEHINRINNLKSVEARIRFISFEPLIGPVGDVDLSGIQWAIIGGESGVKARPIKQEWIKEIFTLCRKYGTAFFFKQWGTWGADEIKRNKKLNGRIFNGKSWNEYPVNH